MVIKRYRILTGLLPPLDIHLLDKDELDEALDEKEISKEQYDLAISVADRLKDDILSDRVLIIKRYKTDLKHMLELVKQKNILIE